jgi:hypothetical protein
VTRDRHASSSTLWGLGVLAILLVAGAVYFKTNKDESVQADNDANRPGAMQPASPPANAPSTTGSDSTTDSR